MTPILTRVLEGEHLLDVLQRTDLGCAIGPDVHDRARALRCELGERAVVTRGEADDLAPADGGPVVHRCVRSRPADRGVGSGASDGNRFSNTTTS